MTEHAVVRGIVVGEPGKPVAGWVSLGKKQPQRWLARSVKIAIEDGREVALELDTIAPVDVRRAAWRELERDPLAQLCEREAPAPDLEVDLTTAVVRGGDAIAAWGTVAERGFVGADDPHRGTAERGVTRLTAHVAATGDDRDALVEAARTKWLAAHAPKPAAKSAAPATKRSERDPDYADRLRWNLPLYVAVLGVAFEAVVAAISGRPAAPLLAIAAFATAPAALDAALLPRFRVGGRAPVSLEPLIITFVLAAAGTLMCAWATASPDVDPERATGIRIAAFVLAGVTLAATGWLWWATRTRRAWIAILVKAPPHPNPIEDAVWGASDGRFSSEVLSIGENLTVFGAAVKDAAGVRQRSVSAAPFSNVSAVGTMRRDGGGTVDVRVGEAATLTMTRLDRATGTDRGVRADLIDAKTPVRVAGRAREGVLVKGGEASLLVFASAPGTDVAREVRRLHRRHLVATALLAAALVAFAAAFVV